MNTLILDGKYQVQEVLTACEGFRACLCIDVETDSGYRPVIVNTYTRDDDIRRLLPAFYDMRESGSPGLVRVVPGLHSVSAIFDCRRGTRLASFFGRNCRSDFAERCHYAHQLLETCLLLDTVPDFIAHACLSQENIMVLPATRQMAMQWILPPEEIREPGFRPRKMALLLSCLFEKNRFLPEAVPGFIGELMTGECPSLAAALSKWKDLRNAVLEEHRRLLAEPWLRSVLRRLRQAAESAWISQRKRRG